MEIKEHMDHAYARRLAGQVAQYLKGRYGARKVLLVGSLVSGFFNPDFCPIRIVFDDIRRGLDEDAVSDCRFHFGHRDPDGLRRLQVASLSQLSQESRNAILSVAEEI